MRFKLSVAITTSALISTASPVSIKNRNAFCEAESATSCFSEGGSNGLAASVVRSFAAAARKSLSQMPPLLPLLPFASGSDPEKCRLPHVAGEVVDSVDGVEST